MADEIVDLLKIKIEKAKRELPLDTVNAIDAVDWRAAILSLRTKLGFTFEQLGDLELETELLLCGLVTAKDYPRELEKRLQITKAAANELVNEMNNLVFRKIQQELIKNSEREKAYNKNSPLPEYPTGGGGQIYPPQLSATPQEGNEKAILNSAGIQIIADLPAVPSAQLMQAGKLELPSPTESREDILKTIEKPETIHPILVEKLTGSVQMPMTQTEHTLENISRGENEVKPPVPQAPKIYPKNADPYRLPPET